MAVRQMPSSRSDFIGLSTDTKPTSITHPSTCYIGSTFFEYDTGYTYICYDGTLWTETQPTIIQKYFEEVI
jgi:hypothetical protein